MSESNEAHVVTCFLRNRGEVLLFRRSRKVSSYAGKWGAVAGYADGDPDRQALVEIDEEAGLADAVTRVRSGESFAVHDDELGKRWVVHPYLFDCARRDVQTNWETEEAEWTSPTSILQRDAVPDLWRSYARVAPSVETIRDDRAHGSAYLSLRALEVLRDRAAALATGVEQVEDPQQALRTLASRLLEAHPSMAALHNRIHRVMHRASGASAAGAVEKAAHAVLQEAVDADEVATARAAELVAGKTVLTLSRSGTIVDALRQAEPAPAGVYVAASQPEGEGVGVAEVLSEAGLDVTLVADAAVAYVLASTPVDLVLAGADAVLPSSRVVNKTGTRAAALAAHAAGIPFYVACASDKVRPDERPDLEPGDASLLYDGQADVRAQHALFDVTPARFVTAVVTERGSWRPGEVGRHAYALRRLRAWRDC